VHQGLPQFTGDKVFITDIYFCWGGALEIELQQEILFGARFAEIQNALISLILNLL